MYTAVACQLYNIGSHVLLSIACITQQMLLAGWHDGGAQGGDKRGGGHGDDQARRVQLDGDKGSAKKEVRIRVLKSLLASLNKVIGNNNNLK